MSDSKRMLRGKAALTIIRGNPGRHVYRNEIVDPRQIWPEDLERLVPEGFLEYVVPDGEGWKLAEDSDDAKAGDSVTVGSTSADVSPTAQQAQADPADPGLVNQQQVQAAADASADIQAKVDALGDSKPDGRYGDAVRVEWLARKGYDRGELAKASPDELRKLVADAK